MLQINLKELNVRTIYSIAVSCVGVGGVGRTHISNRCLSCASLESRAS